MLVGALSSLSLNHGLMPYKTCKSSKASLHEGALSSLSLNHGLMPYKTCKSSKASLHEDQVSILSSRFWIRIKLMTAQKPMSGISFGYL
jgi:hypothetical protein